MDVLITEFKTSVDLKGFQAAKSEHLAGTTVQNYSQILKVGILKCF